jgi:hypothetical protein
MFDWYNINLDSSFERDQCLIDPLTFEIFLIEVGCNLREINAETVTAQFEEDLQTRIDEARSIFKSNLPNIVKYAQEKRNEN